jgi:hypothetical protein
MLYVFNHFVMPGLTRHPVNNGFYWITHTIPGVRPAGQLKLFKIAPGDFVRLSPE